MNPEVKPPILIVDDDEDLCAELRAVLEVEGREVLEARNGKQALTLLTNGDVAEPGVIILDVKMPVMSGWEFLSIIRNYRRLARIPVLLISGASYTEAVARGVVSECLRKPIQADELLRKLAQIEGSS